MFPRLTKTLRNFYHHNPALTLALMLGFCCSMFLVMRTMHLVDLQSSVVLDDPINTGNAGPSAKKRPDRRRPPRAASDAPSSPSAPSVADSDVLAKLVDPTLAPHAIPESQVDEEIINPQNLDPSAIPIAILSPVGGDSLRHTLEALREVAFFNPSMVRVYETASEKRPDISADFPEMQFVTVEADKPNLPSVVLESLLAKAAVRHMTTNQFPKSDVVLFVPEGTDLSNDALVFLAQTQSVLFLEESDVFAVSLLNELTLPTKQISPKAVSKMQRDPRRLLRTNVFSATAFAMRTADGPELLQDWPKRQWSALLRNRIAVFPEVSRVLGQSKVLLPGYFFSITSEEIDAVVSDEKYGKLRLSRLLKVSSKHAGFSSFSAAAAAAVAASGGNPPVLAVPFKTSSKTDLNYKSLASALGLSSTSPPFGSFHGLVLTWDPVELTPLDATAYLVLVPEYGATEIGLTESATLLPASAFKSATEWAERIAGELSAEGKKSAQFMELRASAQGESCDSACSKEVSPKTGNKLSCEDSFGKDINKCDMMKKTFKCRLDKCDYSMGFEQPALEVSTQACLLNENMKGYPFKCEASHHATRRLCPCYDDAARVDHEKRLLSKKQQDGNLRKKPYEWVDWLSKVESSPK